MALALAFNLKSEMLVSSDLLLELNTDCEANCLVEPSQRFNFK